jgi:hypothetical protein
MRINLSDTIPIRNALAELQTERDKFMQLAGERAEALARAEAENAALRADAERYRWGRENISKLTTILYTDVQVRDGTSLDAAIDGARKL